ncbi:hypothetical protein ACWDA7_46780 [Streptomyces sp. NPDC001156]
MTTTKRPTSAAAAPWPKLLAQGMTQPTPDPTRTPRKGRCDTMLHEMSECAGQRLDD